MTVMSGARRSVAGRRLRPAAIGRFAFIAAFLVFLLFPLYWVLVTSIKPTEEYQNVPPVFWPHHPTILHFTAALHSYRGLHGLYNSLIVAFFTMIASVVLGASMGYSLARFRTGGDNLSFWVLSQRFLPPVAIVLPLFLLYRHWGLYDTRFGLILVYTVFTLPLSIWMMYAFFRQLPVEIEEAALVDGCSRWQVLWRVAWPLATPGLVAASAFAFIFAWTEFFFALNLTSQHAYTLPALFRQFLGFQGAQYGESSALTIVSLGPSLVLGLLVQRHLVRGLTLGAVTG